MTVESAPGAEAAPGDPSAAATSEGWGQVAFAINSLQQLSTPMFLRIDADSHEPLFIDFRHRAFVWSTPINEFPVYVRHATFETEPTTADAPPLFRLPGETLDSLLWVMGNAAYGGVAAPWLKPGERYRLAQWPNLTKHLHDMQQMHMLAVLGNAYFSAAELAAVVHVPEADAHNLVNALSMMRLLRVSEDLPAAVPVATAPAPAAVAEADVKPESTSLFARLRARLGR